MIVTEMKTSSWKIKLRVIKLKRKIIEKNFINSINTCNTLLDKQLPKKKKYIRGNQSPDVNKTLSKAIKNKT